MLHMCPEKRIYTWSKYPKMMKIELVTFYLFWLNILTRKGDICNHFGSGIHIGGTETEFNVHFHVPFGNYYQSHEENTPTNTNTPRTIGAIALSHSGNFQGGYKFLSLITGHMVHKIRWTELHIPMEVVDMFNKMTEKENNCSHELDLTPQYYTYIHDLSPDGTNYNDDESNNIPYPHDYCLS